MVSRLFFSLAAALVATAASAQMKPAVVAPPSPLPMAVFGRLPSIDAPAISPDGSVLAAKVRGNGEQYLAVIHLDRPDAKPDFISKDGAFDKLSAFRTLRWRWMDDDNLLIWVATRDDYYGSKFDAVRVVGYNRTSKKAIPLSADGTALAPNDVLWQSTSGPPRILLSQGTQVYEVDVATGKRKLVQPSRGSVAGWYADGDGAIRMGTYYDRDTGKLVALYRPAGGEGFRSIIREKVGKFEEPPVPLLFLPGDKALVTSRAGGFSELYEIDLTTMQLGRKVFGAKGYDISAVEIDRGNKALERITVTDDRRHHVYFEPRLKEVQAILDETFGAGAAEIASVDAKAETVVVRVGGPDQAGAFYLFRTVSGDLKRIGWANAELKDMKLNPVRTVRYPTGDGRTVSAVLTMPRLRGSNDLPLIVLPHGGPFGVRDFETWDMWAQPLAELGYAVIQPNFLGSGGFGKQWEAGADGNWGTRMQDDLNDAVRYLAAQGIADPKRVCMFGWSYGGYAASRAAQRDGDKYRCAVSGAGVHDLPDMVAYDRNYLGRYGSSYLGAAASRLADVSPARFPRQYSIPILIVHGAKDDRVPVSQSRNLVKALKSAGKMEGRDFVYVEQPRNTHHLPLEEDRIQLLEEIRKFLARHNPA